MKINIQICLLALMVILSPDIALGKECKVLTVSGPPNYLPMSFVDQTTGEPKGVSYDLIRMLGNELEMKVNILADLPWPRALKCLESGALDLIVAIYWTPEREHKFAYSIPYHKNAAHLFVKRGSGFPFAGLNDLIGKAGGVAPGASFGSVFDGFAKENNLILEAVQTKKQRFKKLLMGRSDYVIQDKLDGILYLRSQGIDQRVIMLPTAISHTDVHFAVSRKSPSLTRMPDINRFLEKAIRNNVVQQLIQSYSRP